MITAYPRVTHILQSTVPIRTIIKFKKLKDDYEETNGIGSWDINCDKSRTNGTNIHAFLDKLITTNPACENNKYLLAKNDVEEFTDFYRQAMLYHKHNFPTREALYTELSIINHELKYKGTTDLIYRDCKDESVVLLDYKTSKGYQNVFTSEMVWRWKLLETTKKCKAIKEKTWACISEKCRDPFTQVMMYRLAAEQNKGINIDKLMIAVITPYGYQELILPPQMWDDCTASALERIHNYHKMLNRELERTTLPTAV